MTNKIIIVTTLFTAYIKLQSFIIYILLFFIFFNFIEHTTKLVRSLVVFKWQRQSNSTSTHSDQNSNFKLNQKKKKNDVQTSAELHNCYANFYVTRQPPKTGNSCITCTTYIYIYIYTLMYHENHMIMVHTP